VELGPDQLLDYAFYKSKLKSGQIQKLTPLDDSSQAPVQVNFADLHLFTPQPGLKNEYSNKFLSQADDIVAGTFHPFSGEAQPLTFDLSNQELKHWSEYGDTCFGQDIKVIWEPARFTWTYPLCQAYLTKQDENTPLFLAKF
jgi:hypothetical protein